jgi:hypothetical protein
LCGFTSFRHCTPLRLSLSLSLSLFLSSLTYQRYSTES